uniref:Uncharacterized protein n=1 Tax=Glycine max TaxID=3847 RepID=C6TIC6_SOYBN|nr:unknown [Glycine max]
MILNVSLHYISKSITSTLMHTSAKRIWSITLKFIPNNAQFSKIVCDRCITLFN